MTRKPFLAAGAALSVVLALFPVVLVAGPAAAAAPVAGTLLVADPGNHRVVAIAPNGSQSVVPATGLGSVGGVAADGAGNIYISDPDHARIVKVPGNGGPQTDFATGLVGPLGLSVDGWGSVYVSTNGTPNDSALKITPDGTKSKLYCCPAPGAEFRSTDVTVDDQGRYELAIAHFPNLHDSSSKYIAIPGMSFVVKIEPGGGENDTATQIFNIHSPTYLTIDKNQRIYVSYPSSGTVLGAFAGSNPDVKVFDLGIDDPRGVAYNNTTGNLYVADHQHNYVVKYAADGTDLGHTQVTGAGGVTALAIVPPPSPPKLRVAAPADTADYNQDTAPNADFSCTAAMGATLASCTASADGSPLASGAALPDALGAHTVVFTATDTDGQTTTATQHYTMHPALPGAPTVTVTTPTEGATYPSNAVPAASFTCTAAQNDGIIQGLEGCSASIDGGAAVASGAALPSSLGAHTVVVTAHTIIGRTASVTRHYTVSQVVAGKPTASVTTPEDNATFTQGAVPNASFSCTAGDNGVLKSGTDGCSMSVDGGAPQASGTPLAGGVGAHTAVVTATQTDGQTDTVSRSYSVAAQPDETAISVAAPDDSVIKGADYSLTATVADVTIPADVPAGNVTFAVDGNDVGTTAVNGVGKASLTLSSSSLARGQHTVTARFTATSSHFANSSGATDTFRVKENQTIGAISGAPNPAHVGDTFTATATATSGLPVTFGTSTGAVCSVSSAGAVSLLTTGTCTITADQAGNDDWVAAPQQTLDLTVVKKAQVIDFTAPTTPRVVGETDTLSATGGGSGNPVVFSIDGTTSPADACVLSGPGLTTITYQHAGTCVIDANQAGDATYSSADQVSRTVTIDKAPQTITFGPLPDGRVPVGTSFDVTATGGVTGNPVVLSSDTPTVCTIDGGTVSTRKAGDCVIRADQAGDADHLAGTATATIGVGQVDTATVLRTDPRSLSVGDEFRIVADVVTDDGHEATGTVQFKLNGAPVGKPVALVRGSARSRLVTATMPGNNVLTAVFTAADPSHYKLSFAVAVVNVSLPAR